MMLVAYFKIWQDSSCGLMRKAVLSACRVGRFLLGFGTLKLQLPLHQAPLQASSADGLKCAADAQDMMAAEEDIYVVLRLMCLLSLTQVRTACCHYC